MRYVSSYGLDRKKKADLIEDYLELTGQSGNSVVSHPGTRAELIAEINRLLAKHRDRLFHQANAPKKPAADLCEITGAEVNEWLQTLPPVASE